MFFFKTLDGTDLYMGRDKHENEDLIKYAWPEDVWFHVDNLSSAHVYARIALPAPASASAPPAPFPVISLDNLSEVAIRDCAQLVKANSIEGSKKSSVVVIYTLASNLRKDGSMAVGQVGFKNERLVRRFNVGEKDRDTLVRLAKTQLEIAAPDLAGERERRDAKERAAAKAATKAKAEAGRAQAEAFRADKEARSYDRLSLSSGDAKAAAAAEKKRMDDIAAAALQGAAGEDESVAKMKAVRAIEDDFM